MKRRPRRTPPPRTAEARLHEAIGLAIGRVAMMSPTFYVNVTAGFSRASAEKTAGRAHTSKDVADAIGEAMKLALLVAPPSSGRKTPR